MQSVTRHIPFPIELFNWIRDQAVDERREFRDQVIILLEQLMRAEQSAAASTAEQEAE